MKNRGCRNRSVVEKDDGKETKKNTTVFPKKL